MMINRNRNRNERTLRTAGVAVPYTYRSVVGAITLAAATIGGQALITFPVQADPLVPINFTFDFDLVQVTGRSGPDGSTILSATAVGSGPFETLAGPGPIDFGVLDSQGNETDLNNGITTGQIFQNYLSPRYFGSDAEPQGSIIENVTNAQFNGSGFTFLPGTDIGAFDIWLAQPAVDSITSVNGGNAFSSAAIASDGKSVLFSGGDIPNIFWPTAGEIGEFLWSSITEAPQPTTADVFFAAPTIPPDPLGEFADLRLVGQAIGVAEPSTVAVLTTALSGFFLAACACVVRRRR